MSLGVSTSSGKLLTADIGFRKTGSGSSLSAISEKRPTRSISSRRRFLRPSPSPGGRARAPVVYFHHGGCARPRTFPGASTRTTGKGRITTDSGRSSPRDRVSAGRRRWSARGFGGFDGGLDRGNQRHPTVPLPASGMPSAFRSRPARHRPETGPGLNVVVKATRGRRCRDAEREANGEDASSVSPALVYALARPAGFVMRGTGCVG